MAVEQKVKKKLNYSKAIEVLLYANVYEGLVRKCLTFESVSPVKVLASEDQCKQKDGQQAQ